MPPRLAADVRPPLTVAGLFAGIGGVELGLSRHGHHSALLCELEPTARAVLEKRFPGVELAPDVRELRSLPRRVDLLAAGFPCQDLSQAGRTAGIAGAQSGIVGEVFRLLRRRRVPWVFLENVSFMLSLGGGRALDYVIGELEALGYSWAYRVVDSRAFGVPQRRERVFLLASLEADPRAVLFADDSGEPEAARHDAEATPPSVHRRTAVGFYWTEGVRGLGWAVDAVPTLKGGSTIGIPSPPAIVLPREGAGRGRCARVVTPEIRDAERLQGFDADWTLPAAEVSRRAGARWKLVGNAVTVPAAAWLGRRLREPGEYDGADDPELPKGAPWPRAAWGAPESGGRRGARWRRHRSRVSSWPLREPSEPLHSFLRFPTRDLSARATAGFLGRLRSGRLRYPPWFEDAVSAHLARADE